MNTMYNTEELSKYLFSNRARLFQPCSSYRGKDPVMSLITTLLPFVLIILTIALVGFCYVLHKLVKYLAKGLTYLFTTCINKYNTYKHDKAIRKQQEEQRRQRAEEQLRREQELRESTDIYDKSVLELRRLIKNNFNQLNVSVLRTGERKGKKHDVYTWVTFTVYDTDKKQVINVNDLVNNVCYRMLEVSRKDGDYLKGSLIFPYADYMELENRLKVLLQMNFTITLN